MLNDEYTKHNFVSRETIIHGQAGTKPIQSVSRETLWSKYLVQKNGFNQTFHVKHCW